MPAIKQSVAYGDAETRGRLRQWKKKLAQNYAIFDGAFSRLQKEGDLAADIDRVLMLALEKPDNRAFFGTPLDILMQMHDTAIFLHATEPTVESYIRGCLHRLGIEGPPTPEFLLSAFAARGTITIFQPGCRIIPSDDGL
jgi:hypothetical protein